MLILTATVVFCWLTILLAPGTATGRFLRVLLVAAPAARLSRITRGDVASAILLAAGILVIAFVGEGDKARMVMFAVPDVAIWVTTFELSAVVDLFVVLGVAIANLRGVGMRVRATLRRPRDRSTRRMRPASSNDDERHPALAKALVTPALAA